jgi:hypothetical protein
MEMNSEVKLAVQRVVDRTCADALIQHYQRELRMGSLLPPDQPVKVRSRGHGGIKIGTHHHDLHRGLRHGHDHLPSDHLRHRHHRSGPSRAGAGRSAALTR